MYDTKSIHIAQYVVNHLIDDGNPVSLMQLQSILWFADALSVYQTGNWIFEESFVAYPLGPRLLSVQHEFFGYAPEPILRRRENESISDEVSQFLRTVIPYCLQQDKSTLSEMTRVRGGSFEKTYKNGTGRDQIIDGPGPEDLEPLQMYLADIPIFNMVL